MSGRFTPAAATLISTSFLAGCGTGRTIGFNTSADPGTSKPMAVICSGMDFLCGIKACLPFDRSPLRQNDTALLTDAGGGSDRKSVVWGKIVSVRVDLGGRLIIKKKKKILFYFFLQAEDGIRDAH